MKALHAKIGEFVPENDFLEGAFAKAGDRPPAIRSRLCSILTRTRGEYLMQIARWSAPRKAGFRPSRMKPPGRPIIRMTGGLCHSGEYVSVGRDVPKAGGIPPVRVAARVRFLSDPVAPL